jgi:hypothetical protein
VYQSIQKKSSSTVDNADTGMYNQSTRQVKIGRATKACFGWLGLFGGFIMAEVTTVEKQTRVRCSDEQFLEAVFSSKTYAEIADKTGQKVASTMARYARTKKALAEKNIALPEMERKKPVKTVDSVDNMAQIVQRLKSHHTNQ